MKARGKNDRWVFWLTGVFVLVATGVFVFAMTRRGTTARSVPPINSTADLPSACRAGQFRVVRIADGDSLTVIGSDGVELSIRLRGVDAPELGQRHGLQAKEALQELLSSGTLTLSHLGKGKYGRYIANVFIGDTWVNKELVAAGHAWCDQVNAFAQELFDIQRQARARHWGLWSDSDPVPPWIWRAQRK